MLHFSAVREPALGLLRELQSISDLNSFNLVGGTALALIYGHRMSEERDFFTYEEFNTNSIVDLLKSKFAIQIINQAANSLTLDVNKVKIDFIRHNYPLIKPVHETDDIKLLSVEDIAAMKINGILNRGSKKDFYDIYELLNHFIMGDLISFYDAKYGLASHLIIKKSLIYFDDAENQPDPISLKMVKWSQVKDRIISVVKSNS